MKKMKTDKFIRKFFLVTIFSFLVTFNVAGQNWQNDIMQRINNRENDPQTKKIRDALDKVKDKLDAQDAMISNLLTKRQNYNCSSEFVYKIQVFYVSGNTNELIGTAYYCEDEKMQYDKDLSTLRGHFKNYSTVKTEKIKNRNQNSNNNSNSQTTAIQGVKNIDLASPMEVNPFEALSVREQNKISAKNEEQNTPPEINLDNLSSHIAKKLPDGPTINRPFSPKPSEKPVANEVREALPRSSPSFPPNTKKQIAENEEIDPSHPYIELTAGTIKSVGSLFLKTPAGLLLIPTVNIWNENVKAVMAYHNGEAVPSTKEIFYNAFWNQGKVPAEILGGLVSSKIMEKGSGYMIKNATKYGRDPVGAFQTFNKIEDTVKGIKTGIETGAPLGKQLGEDFGTTK
jgi:hypothetical protein